MAEQLRVSVDGQILDVPFGNFPEGSLLKSAPAQIDRSASGLYVVQTPLNEYEPDYQAIARRDGEEFNLGELPTVTHRGVERFTGNIQSGIMYDFFYLHHQTRLDPARISTGTESPPTRLTLEEVALLIVLQAQMTLNQASKVSARVIHNTVHLYNRRQFLHNGLEVGDMVATPSTQDTFGLIYSHKDRSRLFDQVTLQMFANNTRRIAGLPPVFS